MGVFWLWSGSGVTAASLQLLLWLAVRNPENREARETLCVCVLTEREQFYMQTQSDRNPNKQTSSKVGRLIDKWIQTD